MIIDQHQNTLQNGYGNVTDTSESKLLKIWYKFYTGEDGNFPLYSDVSEKKNDDYLLLGNFLNRKIYRSRMYMTIFPYLFEA